VSSLKKIPERMCVSCRQMKPKNQLIRIVNNVNGISIDISGKANGRGVYLCKCKSCIEKALKNKKFGAIYGFSLSELENDLEKAIEQ